MLKHLFFRRRLDPGARILDAGCSGGELTRFLHELGMEPVGLDPSEEAVAAAKRQAPHLSYYCARTEQRLPVTSKQFDLVLARELHPYDGDLFSLEAARSTANLLACLRPGGELILISRIAPGIEDHPGGHLRSCFARHLGAFPGLCRVSFLPDPLFCRSTLRWMLGAQPRCGYATAALRIPETPIELEEWQGLATAMAGRSQALCCRWAGEQVQPARRRAA
jgi:SAM-dependent methyltransferase